MPWEKQFDVDEALDRAIETFRTHGYRGSSMQDLLDAMGINRGSLYDTYGGKHDLFLQALAAYRDRLDRKIERHVDAARSPRSAIEAVFDVVLHESLEEGGERGCLLVNSALEVGPEDAAVAVLTSDAFGRYRALFEDLVRRGQESGEIPSSVEIASAPDVLLGLLTGLRALARTGAPDAALRAIREHASAVVGA